jgi:hypothetical protein
VSPVSVRRPKLRDRGAETSEPARFTSAILPKWARRTKSLDALLPVLLSRAASRAATSRRPWRRCWAKDAPNLSPSGIGRLKEDWRAEYDRGPRRDLSARRYVHVWADGVHLQARMEDDAACMLVVIGFGGLARPHCGPGPTAPPEGRRELVGFQVGVRESARDAGASCSST